MITQVERRWVIVFAVIAMLLTSLPYLIGYSLQGAGWQYSGLLLGIEDGFSYLAKMSLGTNGDWLFRSPYTVHPQQGFFAFFPYILLGKLVGGAGAYTQRIVLFHCFRFFGGIFSIWATYEFCSRFVESIGLRRLAVILGVFGGGFGFLFPFGLAGLWQGIMKMPLEFYSPETFGFISYLTLPHLLWARGLLLMGLVRFLDKSANHDWLSGLITGLLWLVMGTMQPLTVVSGWAVIGMTVVFQAIWQLWLKRMPLSEMRPWLVRAVVAVLVSAPVVLYNFLAFRLDPFLSGWQAQNVIPSPPPGDYLLAWGVVLPLVIVGVWNWRKGLNPEHWLPLAWLVALPLLAYFPYNLQRRLVEGTWIAGCVLVVVGLGALPNKARRAATLWLGLAFLSTAILFVGALLGISKVELPLFRPTAETHAMDYLAHASQKNDVVLATYATSNVLPARAAVRVPIGLSVESLDNDALQARIADFYSPSGTAAARQSLLDELGVRFVFWGPLERAYGDFDLSKVDNLKMVYSAGGYEIFEVLKK